jgi:hypothetical protein
MAEYGVTVRRDSMTAMGSPQNGDGNTTPQHGPDSTPGNGWGLAATIVGAVSLTGSIVPHVNYAIVLLAVVGLVLGVVAWRRTGRRKILAIIGTTLSLVSLVLSVTLAVFFTDEFGPEPGRPFGDGDDAAREVALVYDVTGDSESASVTYATFTNGNPSEEQVPDAPLPFSIELPVTIGGDDEFNIFTVRGRADPGTSVTCTITLDGRVIEEQTSYDTCSASYVPDY